MAAQYSNRHFFRKAPNHLLALFFEAKGIVLAVDFSRLKGNDSEALQTVLNTLTDDNIADLETEFQDVSALACEGGITALVDEANFHGDDVFIEAIAAIEGFHAKAMWAFLNKPLYWRGAAMFLHADNVSPHIGKNAMTYPSCRPKSRKMIFKAWKRQSAPISTTRKDGAKTARWSLTAAIRKSTSLPTLKTSSNPLWSGSAAR